MLESPHTQVRVSFSVHFDFQGSISEDGAFSYEQAPAVRVEGEVPPGFPSGAMTFPEYQAALAQWIRDNSVRLLKREARELRKRRAAAVEASRERQRSAVPEARFFGAPPAPDHAQPPYEAWRILCDVGGDAWEEVARVPVEATRADVLEALAAHLSGTPREFSAHPAPGCVGPHQRVFRLSNTADRNTHFPMPFPVRDSDAQPPG